MQKQKAKYIGYCPGCGSKVFESEFPLELSMRCWYCKRIIMVGSEMKLECLVARNEDIQPLTKSNK